MDYPEITFSNERHPIFNAAYWAALPQAVNDARLMPSDTQDAQDARTQAFKNLCAAGYRVDNAVLYDATESPYLAAVLRRNNRPEPFGWIHCLSLAPVDPLLSEEMPGNPFPGLHARPANAPEDAIFTPEDPNTCPLTKDYFVSLNVGFDPTVKA